MANKFLVSLALIFSLLQCGLSTVTVVYDGDTVMVGDKKVRLIGINTPEKAWHEKNQKEECYAMESKKFLETQVLGKKVDLESDPLDKNKDKYGRLLRYVKYKNQLINAEIVRQGYGFAYTIFPFGKKKEFIRLENEARENKRGLWQHCGVQCKWKICKTTYPNPAKF